MVYSNWFLPRQVQKLDGMPQLLLLVPSVSCIPTYLDEGAFFFFNFFNFFFLNR
jgi:hypothetical protein